MFLEDIADKLEETMESWEQYLHMTTGNENENNSIKQRYYRGLFRKRSHA